MTCSLRRASSVVGCLILASACAFAQASAQLNGRVTDENGAVPPGVTVTATQIDTRSATGPWIDMFIPAA